MLIEFGIFALLLIGLIGARFLISRSIQTVAWRVSGNKRLGIVIYSLIFLPGIIIHEISHFIVAAILGVRTGAITIFPTEISDSSRQRLGSVQIAKTDFVRQSLIGAAPLLVGIGIIIALSNESFLFPLIRYFAIFAVSNTMFLSSSDLSSWPALIIFIILILFVSLWLGIDPSPIKQISAPITSGLEVLNRAFIFALKIDAVGLVPLLILERISNMGKRT